jgi:hypothetical protein
MRPRFHGAMQVNQDRTVHLALEANENQLDPEHP